MGAQERHGVEYERLRKWMRLARHTHSPRDHNSGPTKKDSGQVSGLSEHKRGWGGITPCFRVSMEAVLGRGWDC